MPTSTLTSKGQVTVPKAIRERLGLVEGDVLEFSVAEDGRIEVRRRGRGAGVCGVLRDFAPEGSVSVAHMGRAVRERAAAKAGRRSP
jgi:AbrB family looped-hinge helix DNA binding protein